MQFFLATHSPLVMASLKPLFDTKQDCWFDLQQKDGKIQLSPENFQKQGDVNNWLTSEAFDLDSTYSVEATAAMKQEKELLNADKPNTAKIRTVYQELLKQFPRWMNF